MLNLRTIAVGCVLVGAFFRFANIDGKLFWGDEVFTALRVSGYTLCEMRGQLCDGHLVNLAELRQFQFRNQQRGPADVVTGLALEDSHHPPLYFLSLWAWQSWLGSTLTAARCFSATMSLLMFPALFWLCRELLPEQKSFAWWAVAMAAVSPVHVVFAQQARPYALWSVLICASSAALFRAIRVSTVAAWGLYGILMVMSVYTHVLSVGVAFGHCFVVAFDRRQGWRQWIAFAVTGAAVVLAFAPWLWAIATAPPVQGFGKNVADVASLMSVTSQWGGVFCRIIVDFGANPASSKQFLLRLVPILAPVAALIAFSIYRTLRYAPAEFRLLCGGIIIPFCLLYAGSHVFFGRHVATTRHLLPVLMMVELSVAFTLFSGFQAHSKRHRKLAWLAAVGVLGLGIASCSVRLPTVLWWDQIPLRNGLALEIVDSILTAERALVITDAEEFIVPHTISNRLTDDVVFQLVPPEMEPSSGDGFHAVFLLQPTAQLLDKARAAFGPDAEHVNDQLWTWQVDRNGEASNRLDDRPRANSDFS